MGKAEFEASLREGGHKALAAMAGRWAGTTRVWFEPDQPPVMEVAQRGELRSVLGGRFILHDYSYGEAEHAGEGIALYGLHLDEGTCESAWVDSFHTGTSILFSTAKIPAGGSYEVLGSYGDGKGGPRWGWRTEIAQPSTDALVIRMYNMPPGEDEVLAVETLYQRVK